MQLDHVTTYGLIGNPIAHSLSPVIHNTAFKALEVDAVYKLFPLQENELDNFFKDLRKEESPIFGLNVTVPYKEKVIPYLDSLSPFAQKARAVNTVVITKKKKLEGFNTDGPGFLSHLWELNFDVKHKRVAILAAGGATRAIVAALCVSSPRPASIKIYDIDTSKAESLIKDLGSRLNTEGVEAVQSIDDLDIELSDLLINASPVGLKKNDPCLVEKELLHSNLLVYDLIYNPKATRLLKAAKHQGAMTANGLGMLFYQAVLAFQHWAAIELSPEVKQKMRDNLEKKAGL